jgi:Na+-driven multidrug efflux pump
MGGTVIHFLMFIVSGLYKAVLTIASNLIGAGQLKEIKQLCRSCVILMGIIAGLLMIPLFTFPSSLIYFFDAPSRAIFKETFHTINHWIWMYLFCMGVQNSFCAVLIACKDVKTQLYGYLFLCPLFLGIAYVGLGQAAWLPDKVWLLMVLENLTFLALFIKGLYKIYNSYKLSDSKELSKS